MLVELSRLLHEYEGEFLQSKTRCEEEEQAAAVQTSLADEAELRYSRLVASLASERAEAKAKRVQEADHMMRLRQHYASLEVEATRHEARLNGEHEKAARVQQVLDMERSTGLGLLGE
jgi:hypothetical protein